MEVAPSVVNTIDAVEPAAMVPTILANLDRLRSGVRGQPHLRNIERWQALVDHGDVAGLHRALTGLDRDYVEMREVSPMTGLLTDEDRTRVLAAVD